MGLAPFRSALIAVAMSAATAHAGQATCSNPGVPIGGGASSELLPGRLTLTLLGGVLPISSEEVLDDVGGQVRYDSHFTLVETRLAAEYALSKYLAIGAALPYRVVDVGVEYFDPTTGEPRDPTFAGIHSRPETVTGIGDGQVLAHAVFSRFHVRAGATLPLGSTLDENPFALGAIGQEHEHIQLGTGTVMPLVGVEYQQPWQRWTFSAWGLAYLSLYANSHGYQPGTRISGGLTATHTLAREIVLTAAAEVHGETAEKWDGMVPVDEGNAGRVDVFAGGTVAWRPSDRFAFIADLKVPVYSHVTGNQLDYRMVGSLGVVVTLDTKRRPSYHGLDEAPVGPAGSATPVTPVAGTYTVFDLWASWCAPCRELDERMVALARRHPDQLAVRKLEVVDSDSAAWKAFLAPGKFELPHIKVYRPDGTLLFEASGPPERLVERLEAALR